MPRPAPALALQEADQQQLQQWVSAFGTPQQVALRSQIVLAAAAGQSDNAIAQQLEVNRKTVTLWRARFAEQGLDSLWEVAPGRGRKPTYGPDKIHSIVQATLRTKPEGTEYQEGTHHPAHVGEPQHPVARLHVEAEELIDLDLDGEAGVAVDRALRLAGRA